MGAKRLLAVDLGASGGKCFVGTFEGGSFRMEEIHRFAHDGVSFFLPDRRGDVTERTVWDDTHIYRNILTGLQAFRREVADRLDSIGIDTWGADGHFLSRDGELLGKVYCYRDHRLDTMVEVIKSKVPARRMYELTGIHFQPFNMSNQLHWFVSRRKELMTPGCFFLPVPSLFTYYLGGGRHVDSSWASVTQLMDARSGAWSREILDALDIPAEIMPEIVQPGTSVGTLRAPLAKMLELNQASLTAVAAHDTASAFAAAPVDDPDASLIISSGTWSLVGKLVPAPITSDEAMAANISNEGGVGNIRFLKNCMGTWLVQELRRVWAVSDGKKMDWNDIVTMASSARPFCAFIDPDDPGFYNPANMEEAIVAFCRRTGQEPPSDRGELLRVVYECLALKYRMVNEQISAASGTRTGNVTIVGGGSRNALLNQFAADSLGLPVFAGPEEATAVGNLMVQAMGLGLLSSLADALPLIRGGFPIREFSPGDRTAWDEAYHRFETIVAMAKQ